MQVLHYPLPLKLQPNASYILVGGLRGIGQLLCEWMVAHGAMNLIILSRSAEVSPFLTRLIDEGCKIRTVKCDISDAGQLKKALQECSDMPMVCGVIQGAMVLEVGSHFSNGR